MKLVASCVALLGVLHSAAAFPTGAGRCTRNIPAAAPHGGQETVLADGGYSVTVAGTQVLPGDGATTVTAGQEFDIVLSGPDFRGFLIMLSDEEAGDLVGPDDISKQADGSGCDGEAAITHTSNDLKQEVTVTGVVTDPKSTQIEVNVVVQNSGGVSVYHYDWINLEVVEEAVAEPVDPMATEEAPVGAEGEPTTVPATEAPTEGDGEPATVPVTEAPTEPDLPSIAELASGTPELSTLVSLLPNDLVDTLSEDGTYTVFAPLNSAFNDLPDEFAGELQVDDDALRDVLLYHVLGTVVLSSDLEEGAVVSALNGAELTVTSLNPVTINDAVVVTADILASNGVVHLIDKVLLPPTAETQAPTGGFPDTLPVDGTQEPTGTTTTPFPTDSGSGTLPVDETQEPTASEAPSVGGGMTNYLSDVAIAEEDLSTLVQAAVAADAVDALSSPGTYTVFAPTNEAFANFPDQDLLAMFLTEDWKVHLQVLLLFHVSREQYAAEDLFDGQTIDTVLVPPEALTVGVTPNGVTISGAQFSDANVVEADLFADNGVLHKVDQIFFPTALSLNLLEAASLLEGFDQIGTLVVTAGLEDTLTSSVVTVFGPTNDAFANLDPETVQLISDPDALRTALENHIVDGLWYKERLTAGTELISLAGNTLTITEEQLGGRFSQTYVNGAFIEIFDAVASNGLAHVISEVLLPPAPGNETETMVNQTMVPDNGTEPPEIPPEGSTPAPTFVSTEPDTSSSAVVSTMIASLGAMIAALVV